MADTIDIQMLPNIPYEFTDTTSSVATDVNNIVDSANTVEPYGLNFKFDFDKNEFVIKDGKLVELSTVDAIKQWIILCLKTQFEEYKSYYFTGFGVNTQPLLGLKRNEYKISRVEEEISTALKQNRYIKDVTNFTETYDKNILNVNFDVYLINGTILEDQEYSFTQ